MVSPHCRSQKDMIVVSGFNVYPNELEDVLVAHPDVVECAAIGIASESTGEAIRCMCVATRTCQRKQCASSCVRV